MFSGGSSFSSDSTLVKIIGDIEIVCAYDSSLTSSKAAPLSCPRAAHSAATIGNHLLFAGGYSKDPTEKYLSRVESYDASLTRSTAAELSSAKIDLASATVGESTNSKFSKRKDGLYIDPTFERNYAECKRVGLPVGVYYYTYATTKAMADAELAVLKTALAGKTFEMPVCVDVEDNKLVKLNKGSLTALVDYELRTLESWSVYALLYTGLNFSLTRLNMAKLKAYDVWVAAYRKSMKKPATSYKYGIWQYTDEARIPGVSKNADMSYAYKDYPTIIKRAGLSRVKGA